jgi:hypothetical protein
MVACLRSRERERERADAMTKNVENWGIFFPDEERERAKKKKLMGSNRNESKDRKRERGRYPSGKDRQQHDGFDGECKTSR